MELRHLRYFAAVAEELHFGRAANRLHVAQPAISEQVRKLECELGVQLFDRNPRGVSMTAAGRALLDEARRVLQQAEVAAHAARNAHAGARMRLRVAYLPDALPSAVSKALRQLAAGAPKISVELEAGSVRRLVDDLHLGRLDAVVTSLPTATGKARITPIGYQHTVAALPAGHPQATSPALVLEWVARERLLVLPAEANPAFRSAVVAQCRDAGVALELSEVARIEDALLAVTAGSGIALFPESVAERHVAAGIRFLPLRGQQPAFETAVLTMPGAENLATKAFLRAVSYAVGRQASKPAPAARDGVLAHAPRA